MNWKRTKSPEVVNSCDCGSNSVEQRADGLVVEYRCVDCGTSLGDTTMGHEP